ncbi:maleylpyruvate isomerase N-terminal domain-containing protein [Nocardioides KLBMP 9356]|uniref:Maleylpyruvate isomerase N-terminal domain-containing protein n=1 Tax=Nocardioides potassii TaxID=2911371 RepID=A0ABS9H955_9ACTN|nr:maleylpyruvate isomerase N-terminal domain-containing protein [Nocardioides potassii]MCF6376759.1 maleylpyruvate isomerase N-terminal domain-containing protein [Nocardioides potassii]
MSAVLRDTYAALASVVGGLQDEQGWTPTGCVGWTAHDLVWHLHADAVRALVAAHTPAGRAADCDAVDYWRQWGSDPQADERNRRMTRVEAGLHSFGSLCERYLEASAAAALAVSTLEDDEVLLTQGHAIVAADLASTLAVEATLHHLDLVTHLDQAPPPAAQGLRETRRVVEELLGRPVADWTDERVALVGTGRAEPTPAERDQLGEVRLPVFS